MYPIKLGFDDAIRRIESLRKNEHDSEALVTSVFTLEKTIRRSLKLSILARGFSMRQSELLTKRKGFQELKELWPFFDRHHRGLPEFIGGREWSNIPRAVETKKVTDLFLKEKKVTRRPLNCLCEKKR